MEGWIKLHRKILEDALWHNCTPEQKVILITILLLANHQPNEWIWKGKKCSVSPGQFITSTESLRAKCGKGITTKAIRNALAKFKKFGFVAIEGASDGTKLTVCKWDSYQRIEDEGGKPSGKQGASDGQAMGKAGATNKNDKNEKELKEGEEQPAEPENFNCENFIELYPKNCTPAIVRKEWTELVRYSNDFEQVREMIKKQLPIFAEAMKAENRPASKITEAHNWLKSRMFERDWRQDIKAAKQTGSDSVQPKRAPKKTHYSAQELDYYRKMGKTPPPLN